MSGAARKGRLRPWWSLVAAALATAALAQDAPTPTSPLAAVRVQSLDTRLDVAAHRVYDVDGDGRDDILVVADDGSVRVYRGNEAGAFDEKPSGTLVLLHPERSLLAVADVLGSGVAQLAVLSPDGLTVHEVGPDGAYRREGLVVTSATRQRLRVGRPTFADVLRDVNADGRPDLIFPRGETCELWIHDGRPEGDAKALPVYRRGAAVSVDLRRSRTFDGEQLSDVLENSFHVPDLDFEDVNGDGRADLVVADDDGRAFHMQREDGTIPATPDVTVDLSVFRDTTPEAGVRLGETLATDKKPHMEVQDLDGDGIADYVIAHRRKVWVFHGSKAGPQFTEPSDVLRTAEDVTVLLVAPIDGDEHPDLVLLRVQVPALGAILKGLFSEWDVDVSAVGYASDSGRTFERKPRWKSSIAIRLPALIGVLRNPEALMKKFEGLSKTYRRGLDADFDGDGRDDLALESEDELHVDVWRGSARAAAVGAPPGDVADLLFRKEEQTWTLDALVGWFADLGRRNAEARTGGRSPDARIDLADPNERERAGLAVAHTGGRSLLVVAHDPVGGKSGRVFDVYRFE